MKNLFVLALIFLFHSAFGQQPFDELRKTQSFYNSSDNTLYTFNPLIPENTLEIWDVKSGNLQESIVLNINSTNYELHGMKVKRSHNEMRFIVTKGNTLGIYTLKIGEKECTKDFNTYKYSSGALGGKNDALGYKNFLEYAADGKRLVRSVIKGSNEKDKNYFKLSNNDESPATWIYKYPMSKKLITTEAMYLPATNEVVYSLINTKTNQKEIYRKLCDSDKKAQIMTSMSKADYDNSLYEKVIQAKRYNIFEAVSCKEEDYYYASAPRDNKFFIFNTRKFNPKVNGDKVNGWTTDKMTILSTLDFTVISEFEIPTGMGIQDINPEASQVVLSDNTGTHFIYNLSNGKLIQKIVLFDNSMNEELEAALDLREKADENRKEQEEIRKQKEYEALFKPLNLTTAELQQLKQDKLRDEIADLPIYKTINGIDIKYKESYTSFKVGKKWYRRSILDIYFINSSSTEKGGTWGVLAEGKGWDMIGGSVSNPIFNKSGREFSGNFCLSPSVISTVNKELSDIQFGLDNIKFELNSKDGECSN